MVEIHNQHQDTNVCKNGYKVRISGCKIPNSVCGRIGVKLRFKFVKHNESEDLFTMKGPDIFSSGTSVLKHLDLLWV